MMRTRVGSDRALKVSAMADATSASHGSAAVVRFVRRVMEHMNT